MKTTIIFITLLILGTSTFAQEDKYTEIMKENLLLMDSAKDSNDWLQIANTMERIAETENSKWLPSYYASLSFMLTGIMSEKKKDQEEYYEKALNHILKCETIVGIDSSEALVLKAQIWQMQISLKPMKLGRTLGPQAEIAIKEAMRIDPENPRAYLLRGQTLYYTPEAFGGDKVKACEDFNSAKERFEAFEPETEISPKWGLDINNDMLEFCEEFSE